MGKRAPSRWHRESMIRAARSIGAVRDPMGANTMQRGCKMLRIAEAVLRDPPGVERAGKRPLTMKAVSVETKIVCTRHINAGPYQQVLRGPQQKRQDRRRAHDPEKLKNNVRAPGVLVSAV